METDDEKKKEEEEIGTELEDTGKEDTEIDQSIKLFLVYLELVDQKIHTDRPITQPIRNIYVNKN